jgi:hypothetical protein
LHTPPLLLPVPLPFGVPVLLFEPPQPALVLAQLATQVPASTREPAAPPGETHLPASPDVVTQGVPVFWFVFGAQLPFVPSALDVHCHVLTQSLRCTLGPQTGPATASFVTAKSIRQNASTSARNAVTFPWKLRRARGGVELIIATVSIPD